MARSLEDLIVLKRTALRYILARESRLLALGKRPVNQKISNFVKSHQDSSAWSNFFDTLNEDLTRNINIYEWRFGEKRQNRKRTYRLFSETKEILIHRSMFLCGGKMTESPVVTVEQGLLQGRIANTPSGKAYHSFQGVPYAKPPLGSLRFKAPQPIESWEGIRDATAEANVSAQIDPISTMEYTGDENCLFLNVYTPNVESSSLPVMVWTHGGGLFFGSGNADMYGPDYLVEKDVVIVTVNYRLGALGFLSLDTPEVPGNAGVRDVILALDWVKKNIHNFGGDASNITVFGESAGGALASVLTASPLSKHLISKAIIQSGTALFVQSFQQNPVQNARNLAKKLGFEGDNLDDLLEFLNATPAKDIVEAQNTLDTEDDFPNVFGMVVEKEFVGVDAVLSEPFIAMLTSGRVAHIPTMIGSTTLEFAMEKKSDDLQSFISPELNIDKDSDEAKAIAENIKNLYFKGEDDNLEYYKLFSDKIVNIDTHRHVQYLTHNSNSPVYFYKFDYVGGLNVSGKIPFLNPTGFKGAMHLDDLGYLFKNDFQKDQEPTEKDVKMRERIVRLWTNFAKTGNPTPDQSHYIPVTWLPVTKETVHYLNLGAELTPAANYDAEKMAFWDELYSKHFKIWDQSRHNTTNAVTSAVITVEVADESDNAPKIVDEIETVAASEPGIVETESVEVETVETKIVDEPIIVNDPIIVDEPVLADEPPKIVDEPVIVDDRVVETVDAAPEIVDDMPKAKDVQRLVDNFKSLETEVHVNGNGIDKPKPRTSNEIKMVITNGAPKDVIRANDPPEDDLPKNIGVNKFVNFFESLGGKK